MSEHNNVAILKAGYEIWSESKAEAGQFWIDLLADDVQWCSVVDERSPGMAFAKDRSCKAEVLEYFQALIETWEMEHCLVEEYIAQADRVVVLGTCKWKNKETGKSVETKKVDIFRMRDGLIIEFCEYFDTAKAIEASTEK